VDAEDIFVVQLTRADTKIIIGRLPKVGIVEAGNDFVLKDLKLPTVKYY